MSLSVNQTWNEMAQWNILLEGKGREGRGRACNEFLHCWKPKALFGAPTLQLIPFTPLETFSSLLLSNFALCIKSMPLRKRQIKILSWEGERERERCSESSTTKWWYFIFAEVIQIFLWACVQLKMWVKKQKCWGNYFLWFNGHRDLEDNTVEVHYFRLNI